MSKNWHIYLGEIPHSNNGPFWVSFESDPRLKKNKSNIYGRCLPCIRNLYEQLQKGSTEIHLGTAYDCWKITAIMEGIDQCISLLSQFEMRFPTGHVYGKLGTGRTDSKNRVVVFHADKETERDRIQDAVIHCLSKMDTETNVLISRGCAALHESILGDWREWKPVTPVRFPEKVDKQLDYLKRLLFRSSM
jgi:hypothetical protein